MVETRISCWKHGGSIKLVLETDGESKDLVVETDGGSEETQVETDGAIREIVLETGIRSARVGLKSGLFFLETLTLVEQQGEEGRGEEIAVGGIRLFHK